MNKIPLSFLDSSLLLLYLLGGGLTAHGKRLSAGNPIVSQQPLFRDANAVSYDDDRQLLIIQYALYAREAAGKSKKGSKTSIELLKKAPFNVAP